MSGLNLKPTMWQKFKIRLKLFWTKLLSKFSWKSKIVSQLTDQSEETPLLPPQFKPPVTPAVDTPSKKLLIPTPSFVDNLENCSVRTLTETLIESPTFDFGGSYLGSEERRQQKLAVAPSSSWVHKVLGTSMASTTSSASDLTSASTLEIPELPADDIDDIDKYYQTNLARYESSEDIYLYSYRP